MKATMCRLAISLITLVAVTVLPSVSGARADEQHSELPAPSLTTPTGANPYRVLFIGNSITRHGTNPEIVNRLHWDHVAGMAASDESKDFVHLLTAKIQAALPKRAVAIQMTSIVPGGLGTPDERLAPVIKAASNTTPDLVIFQHGEHEHADLGADAVAATYNKVLDYLAAMPSKPKIVCVGNWAPGMSPDKPEYAGWTGTVEHTMRDICAARAIPFVSVAKIAADPACHGAGEHPGVKWHPNDAGHAGYANAIFDTVKPLLPKQ